MKNLALLLAALMCLSGLGLLVSCSESKLPEHPSTVESLTEADTGESYAASDTGEDSATPPSDSEPVETEPEPVETEPPYTGSLPSDRGFRAEYIQNDGTGSTYGGADPADLTGAFIPYTEANWDHLNEDLVTPLFTILWNGYRDANYIGVYDKLTGKTELLCPDDYCTHEFCVWYESPEFLYIGKEHIYFTAGDWDNQSVFRCDLNRENVELLFTLNSYEDYGNIGIYHEDGDLVYVTRSIPGEDGNYASTYGVFDCSTWAFTPIYAEEDMYIEAVTGGDTLWCRKYLDENYTKSTVFCANLDFSEIETLDALDEILKDSSLYIQKITEDYVVIGRKSGGVAISAVYLYDHKADTVMAIPESVDSLGLLRGVYVGNYVYYTRDLTEEEWADSPLEDYYEYETSYDIVLRPGSGTVITRPGETVTADREGGRIWRMNLDTFEEECVLSLTYNDVPVKLHSFSMDGTVCYISYETYEEYWNYFNPEEDQHLPEHHLVVDFGTGEILLSDEEVTYD